MLLILVSAGTFYYSNAQTKTEIIAEINKQVWIPFRDSFGGKNEVVFSSLHSKDMVRVIQDNNELFGYDIYFKKVPDSTKLEWAKWEKNIELRFVQRIVNSEKAFEVGYYKTTSKHTETGETRKNIGKFHVLLRKENGQWKIYMDADTSAGASETAFEKAAPITQ